MSSENIQTGTEKIQQAADEWQRQDEIGTWQQFYWAQKTQRTLRLLLRFLLLLLIVSYGVYVICQSRKEKADAAFDAAANAAVSAAHQKPAEVTVTALPSGIEALPRERVVPRPQGTSPLSVLDLDTVTPELCAANLAAIQSKDFSKLKGRIATKLTNGKTEWLKGTGDEITIIQRMVPVDPSLAGTVSEWQILSLTKSTLAASIAVREGVAKAANTKPSTTESMGFVGEPNLQPETATLFPIFRDGKKIYCFDLAASLPLDGGVDSIVALPSIDDTTSTVSSSLRPLLKIKKLSDAQPGEFTSGIFLTSVESIDDKGGVKGHLLDPSTLTPTADSIEIRPVAKPPEATTGKGMRWDTSCIFQVIQKKPLILIDRTPYTN